MNCPNCGAEVRAEDKFCGECGKPLRREIEIAPIWKWGSMIASLVLVFMFYIICWDPGFRYQNYGEPVLIISGLLGFPATIYLMYRERTVKIKYGLAWILFPILIMLFFSNYDRTVSVLFSILVIPAIVIDAIYVYEAKWKWESMIASLLLLFIFWMLCMDQSYDEELLLISLIFGYPATIYLMYKERTEKIKYGLAWILFPFLTLLFGLFSLASNYGPEDIFVPFLLFAIPAIAIDIIYVYKT